MADSAPAYGVRELQRLAEAPLRRPWLVIVPLVLTHIVALGVSLVLPTRYSSSTLILIAPDAMPRNLVPQIGTERTARRLQTLRQEVQSRTRLEMVARELDPYNSLGKEPLINTIENMRDAITVSVKGNDAFSVAFEHSDPKMAMLVADRLTTLFMEEVVGARERQVSNAYEFLEKQLQDARTQLEEKETALRTFKEAHMGQLPEQVQANLSTLQRLQLEQQATAESLRKATDTVLMLESAKSAGVPIQGTPPPPDSLEAMRAVLTQLRTRYTDQHPDVRGLKSRIEALEKTQARSAAAAPGAPSADLQAQAVDRRIAEARREAEQQRARLGQVENRIASFQSRVEAAPRREQEVLGLMRDYKKLSDNYSQLLDKKLDAELASRLEAQQKGQQFRVLDPAYMPEKPSFPDRTLFAIGGAIAGLLLGLGLAIVIDVLDPTMKDAEGVAAAFTVPVLSVIPYVKPRDQARLASLPIDGAPTGYKRKRGMLSYGRSASRKSAAGPK